MFRTTPLLQSLTSRCHDVFQSIAIHIQKFCLLELSVAFPQRSMLDFVVDVPAMNYSEKYGIQRFNLLTPPADLNKK
jgi:hypothetical protein